MAHWCMHDPGTCFHLTGEDTFAYLQTQVSQDLGEPQACMTCCYTLWLSVRGKVEADSFVLKENAGSVYLLSYAIPGANLRRLVERHLIAEEVELRDLTAGNAILTVWEEGAARLLESVGLTVPSAGAWTVDSKGKLMVLESRLAAPPAFDLVGPIERLQEIDTAWSRQNGGNKTGRDDLEKARIAAGIPLVGRDVTERDTPFETGLVGSAVSFQKGCYLGQEVMSKLRSSGNTAKALYLLCAENEKTSGLATGPHSGNLQINGREVGEIRSSAGGNALALLRRRAIQEPGARLEIAGHPESVWSVLREVN